jgi:hypothetical protein
VEKPLQVMKILKRPETTLAVSRPLRPIEVEKTLGSRMTTTITQRRKVRDAKAALHSIEPVSVAAFRRLSTTPSAEMFAIIIKDIREHIEKQT